MMASEKLAILPSPLLFSFITWITDNAIGNIIMVVAVLLSHMLSKPVDKIKPSTILSPLVPVSLIMFNAILRCKFHFSIASPSINPPINKKITGFAYGAAASSIEAILNKGKKMSGMSATTGIGNASVIHQAIIRPPTANTFEAACPTWKGSTKYKIKATTNPASKEISLRFCFETTAKGVVYYFKIQRSLLNHADVKLNRSYKHKK